MHHPLADRLPELNSEPFRGMSGEHRRLDSYNPEEQCLIIEYLHMKLCRAFCKRTSYGTTVKEQNESRDDWICGLCDLTFPAIMGGLYVVLSGKTEYSDFPPSSPIAFHRICKNIGHYPGPNETKLPRLGFDKDSAKERSDIARRASRAILLEELKENPHPNSGQFLKIFGKGEPLTDKDQETVEEQKKKVARMKYEIEKYGHVL